MQEIEFSENVVNALGIMSGIGLLILMASIGAAVIIFVYRKGKK